MELKNNYDNDHETERRPLAVLTHSAPDTSLPLALTPLRNTEPHPDYRYAVCTLRVTVAQLQNGSGGSQSTKTECGSDG